MNNLNIQDLENISRFVEQTSIWKVASIKDEPETILTQWSVWKVNNETIHFVGWAGYEGRVCSAVETYDPLTKRGITRSGRIYELSGPHGYDSDALYVWRRWLALQDNPESVEVTGEYL